MKENTISINIKESDYMDVMSLIHMKFILKSYITDLDGNRILDNDGEFVYMVNAYSHFDKNKIFDKLIELNENNGLYYEHQITYEAY